MLTQTATTPANNPNENKDDLSSEEIQRLTSELKSEIDQEIKKQFAENQALEHAQEKVNDLLTSQQEVKPATNPLPPETTSEKPKETPGIGEILANPGNLSLEEVHLDPLRSSVENAISSLKEGDTISKDWVLKKVLTTSFGNNKSSFYELENRAGAHWTLSPEEMKEVLRAEILSQNGSQVADIEGSETETPNLSPEKTPDGPILKSDSRVESSEDGLTEKKSEEKDKQEKVGEVIFQAKEKENSGKNLDLTKEQIDLINKLHNDKNSWSTFTTFSPTQWEQVYNLYQTGKLIDIGIDAHPLLDQIEKPSLGDPIQIEKGASIAKLLTDNGYNLNWSKDDALVLGCHILANYDILNNAIKKVEQSGIAVSLLESKKDVINLIVAASNSNAQALNNLQENLRFLPVNEKFKVIKPTDLDNLKKFI